MSATPLAGALAILILGAAASLHVYWAAGGHTGLGAAVPQAQGRPLFRPGRLATGAVALALGGLVALLAARLGWWAPPFGAALLPAACWLAAGVFLARAIGDFRHVGFFKRASVSRFARLDTRCYSPLCLLLAGLVAVVAAG
jgi:hypothetical protein